MASITKAKADKEATSPSSPTHPQKPSSFLREKQILARLPISRGLWWRGVKEGIYPQPVRLASRTTAWRADEIEALFQRISEHGRPSGVESAGGAA